MSKSWLRHTKKFLGTLTCATLALSGCSTDGASGALQMPAGPNGATLSEMGFVTAELGTDGTPIYLSGQMATTVRDGDAARALILRDLGRAFRLAPGSDLRVLSDGKDQLGNRYFKLQQLHAGVPVVGAEIVVQAQDSGAVLSVLGQLAPGLALSTAPEIGAQAAISRAMAGILGQTGQSVIHEAPTLHIFIAEGAAPQLAWRAVVEQVGPGGWSIDEIYAAARGNGAPLLAQYPRVYTALNRKIYDFAGKCYGTTALPGTLVQSEGGGPSMDEAVNGAYDGTGGTYWFYKHFLGRDSFDDLGAQLTSTVNLKFPGGISCSGANAAWIDANRQMVYGTGDATNFKNLALGIDVTAHELTHAVTARTSNLTYSNESGALNEAMSDIIGGAGAEAWLEAGGGAAGNPGSYVSSEKTWKIGEDVVRPTGMYPDGLRSMKNPTSDNYSKDYYPDRIKTSGDNGGVHGNSGIANLAFYLMSQGGVHPRAKTTVQVQGIGLGPSVQIFYLANAKLFTASTDFRKARYATAQAAVTLYGRCSDEWVNTHRAWDAVGVLGSWTLCVGPRGGF